MYKPCFQRKLNIEGFHLRSVALSKLGKAKNKVGMTFDGSAVACGLPGVFFKNAREYNRNSTCKIYINEFLTKKRKDSLIKSNQMKRERNLNVVIYTYRGDIIAKDENGTRKTIRKLSDLL